MHGPWPLLSEDARRWLTTSRLRLALALSLGLSGRLAAGLHRRKEVQGHWPVQSDGDHRWRVHSDGDCCWLAALGSHTRLFFPRPAVLLPFWQMPAYLYTLNPLLASYS